MSGLPLADRFRFYLATLVGGNRYNEGRDCNQFF